MTLWLKSEHSLCQPFPYQSIYVSILLSLRPSSITILHYDRLYQLRTSDRASFLGSCKVGSCIFSRLVQGRPVHLFSVRGSFSSRARSVRVTLLGHNNSLRDTNLGMPILLGNFTRGTKIRRGQHRTFHNRFEQYLSSCLRLVNT